MIGKLFGVRDLGIYDRAVSTRQLPTGVNEGNLQSEAQSASSGMKAIFFV